MSDDATSDGELDDAIAAKVSDFLDGALAADERAEVERKIADDPAWQRAHGELTETRKVLSGLRKARAPASFTDGVAETIHQRSGGGLFARPTLGSRVPFALIAVALAVVLAVGYVLWSSLGSLRTDHAVEPHSSGAVAPP